MRNILSVDVEEYFHATEVRHSQDSWAVLPSRIELQTEIVLDLLERNQTTATFFILGWVADRHPRLVRKIAEAGHEIGCHSYAHQLIYNLTPAEFRKDTRRAVGAIEQACGKRPRVYRAPSYSITMRSMWAMDILTECGFTHDSSIYPIRHDRYGIPGFTRYAKMLETASGRICEVPVATVRLRRNTIAPIGGGAYLRLLPYSYTAAGMRRLNHSERQPACMYFHPWEVDPGQPRIAAGPISRLRTYWGLNTMASKLDRLLSEFAFSTLTSVYPVTEPALVAEAGLVESGPRQ